MEKGAKTTPGISPGTPPKLPISVPYLLRDLMEGLVAFGVPLFGSPLEFPLKCPTHSGSIHGWDFMLGNQDPGSTKKEKDDKKGSKKKLGQPETFLRNEWWFLLGLREIWRHFLAFVEGEYLKIAQVYVNLFGPLVMRTWYTAACPPPSTHVCLRKTPLSAEEQKEFAQLQSLDCSEDVLPLPLRNLTHPPARQELRKAEGKGIRFFPEKEAQNH